MKQLHKTCIHILVMLCSLTTGFNVSAQDSVAAEPSVNLRYFMINNNVQFLLAETRIKKGKKFTPLPRQVIKVFLDSNNAEDLIGKTYTDENGKAKMIIPPALKSKWINSSKHKIIGVLEASSIEDERTSTIDVSKSKIEIDTTLNEGVRSVNVKVMAFEDNNWVPAKDIEMKVGIDRLGGILSAGDEATYTTDSTGSVTVDFKKDSIPGDAKGNIKLVAQIEDNDQYGNVLIEKTVPWGIAMTPDKNFFAQRTLWSTRFRTPLWLLFMAYSIMIIVWGTIIYLVFQIVKIKKLGVADTANNLSS